MPQSDLSVQQIVLAEVGDANDVVASLLPAIWDSYADKALAAPRLRELYVKRRVIDIVRAQLRNQVDVGMGPELMAKKSQRLLYLQQMRAEVQDEIGRLERRLMATRFVTATITAVTPEVSPAAPNAPHLPDYIDANAPWLRGSPYYDSLTGGVYDGTDRRAP